MSEDRYLEEKLDNLFQSYKAACPDPDASPFFTSGLWEKIEARRSFSYQLGRWARGLVTFAAAATAAMALYLAMPHQPASSVYQSTYVEALNEAQGQELALAHIDDELAAEIEAR
jgi:hypothetical protein